MFFNFDKPYVFIIIAVIIVLILIGIILLFRFSGKGVDARPVIDVSNIVNAIGEANIKSVEQTQKRVRIQVNDVSIVNLEALKEVSNGIFITGDKLIMTFKEKTEEIVEALRRKI